MLYERWQQVVRGFRNEIALRDLASGRRWTFSELDGLAAATAHEPVLFPRGMAAEFIATVLRGWRSGALICPLEPSQDQPAFPLPPKNIAHLKMTSASTGPARLVAFTGDQLAADARNIVETMGLRREWPNLGVISFAHSYGFSNLITPLLLHGIPLVTTSSPLPEAVGGALREIGPVTLAGVPALWRAWLDARVLSAGDVRLAISAGAPLSTALEADVFKQNGIKVHNFYGSTECGGIAYDATGKPRGEASYAGLPMKNVTLSVGVDGCLEVCGGAVAESYWPQSDERLGNGRFRTADLARIEKEGVYLLGRASDVINVAGRKVSPETIESVLLTHPGVRTGAVFGVPEGDRERIVACVVLAGTVSSEELRQFLLARLPAWQVPRDFWIREDLKPDGRGKLSRGSLRAQYLAR